jgi:hypothetical protein
MCVGLIKETTNVNTCCNTKKGLQPILTYLDFLCFVQSHRIIINGLIAATYDYNRSLAK